jgi:hypothetical protein
MPVAHDWDAGLIENGRKAAEGRRSPRRFARIKALANATRFGLRQPSGALRGIRKDMELPLELEAA